MGKYATPLANVRAKEAGSHPLTPQRRQRIITLRSQADCKDIEWGRCLMNGDVEWRDIALICLNGHVINAATDLRPQLNSAFCPRCGEPAISACSECQTPIPGQARYFSDDSGTFGFGDKFVEPAPYCGGCGKPYQWTERRAKAFVEMAQLELSAEAARDVEANLPDVMRDTPRTEVAVRRIKAAFETIGKDGLSTLKQAAPNILTQVAMALLEHYLNVK